MAKRSVIALITLFVLLGVLVCADGIAGGLSYRAGVVGAAVLAMAMIYVGAVTFHDASNEWLYVALFALAPMLATATMLLPSLQFPYSWVPFAVMPLFTVVIWMEVRHAVGKMIEDLFAALFSSTRAHVDGDRVRSALFAVWITAGGIYIVGRLLGLSYVKALHEQSFFRGILDIRALIVVSLLVPAAVRAAIAVRSSAPRLPYAVHPMANNSPFVARLIDSFLAPLLRFAHLIYRALQYVAVVLQAWSKAFADQLRALLTDAEAYKSAGQVVAVYTAYALVALSANGITPYLSTYLRLEPPWAGGSLAAIWLILLLSIAVLELLVLALAVRASLARELAEADVIVAAELLGWAIVSSVCAGVLLWLTQRFAALRMSGFSTPGILTALVGVVVTIYLAKLFRSPSEPSAASTV